LLNAFGEYLRASTDLTETGKFDKIFVIRQFKTNSRFISFESAKHPGYYMTQKSGKIYLDQTDSADIAFQARLVLGKGKQMILTPAPNAEKMVVIRKEISQYVSILGRDWPGNNIKTLNTNNAAACADACNKENSCVLFSITAEPPLCRLKWARSGPGAIHHTQISYIKEPEKKYSLKSLKFPRLNTLKTNLSLSL
jgi:hypothetical protein